MRRRSSTRGLLMVGTPFIALATALVQVAFAPWIQMWGGVPNFLVATTVALALHFGPWAGVFWGLAVGGLADVLVAHPLGLLALPLLVVGYVAGLGHRFVFESRVLAPLSIGAGATWLDALLQVPLTLLWGYSTNVRNMLVEQVLPASVYTALWTWAFFLLLLVVHRLRRQERLAL